MEQAAEKMNSLQKTSLNHIVYNWMATLFAYQPEVYFQLDEYRRKLSLEFVSPETLHNQLIRTGLLQVLTDVEAPSRLTLRLDCDMFSEARGMLWTVTVHKNGEELEFACSDDDDDSTVAQMH